ncbi:MAG: hypothetical protein HRT53_11515 [Colwellia sp.]|nr:hypothetical protein [Colwellia sp.]
MLNQDKANIPNYLAHSLKATIIALTLLNSSLTIAQDKVVIAIPTVSDARVFAEFKDKMPAVVNYFTEKTEEDIVAFYQNEYGQPLYQERKRGRLTLNFSQETKDIRVIISQQDRVRQVDVIIENNPQE